MTAFVLLVDRDHAAGFTQLGAAEALEPLALTRFRFQAPQLTPEIRQRVLELTARGKTCFVLPQRHWHAVFFDMDSTVIAEESIVELARAAGKAEAVAMITEQAMAGQLDFPSALRTRVAMLRGLPESTIAAVGASLTINPGMRELAREAPRLGVKLFLVSGGFQPLARIVAEELGFSGYLANELEVDAGQLTGQLRGQLIDGDAKARFLVATCAKLEIPTDAVLAVGDGANDIPMIKQAGGAIAYFPKPILLPHVDGANFSDHRALLHALRA